MGITFNFLNKEGKISSVFFSFLFLMAFQMGSSQTITIGNGTTTTDGTNSDPVDDYYKFMRYQTVYTAAELSAAGLSAGDVLTGIGFSISESPGTLNNYTIKLGHTNATNAANHIVSTSTTVKNPFTYTPTVVTLGNFDMISFDSNFIWNGTDNIFVDICTGENPFSSPYGGVRVSAMTNGSRYTRSDSTDQCGVNTNSTNNNRPNVRFSYFVNGPCTSPPTGGTTVLNPAGGVPGSTVNGTVTGSSYGTGLDYQWQYSDDNGLNWDDISGQTGTNLTTTAIPTVGTRQYRREIICSGNSEYSIPATYTTYAAVPSSGNNSYTLCSGTLYDSGGPSGDYAPNSNGYTVLNPATPGSLVRISGSITSEGGYDYLTIYDGAGIGGTILWGGSAHGSGTSCNTFTVPVITSTSGSLTVRFYSDGSFQCAGFALNIQCFTPAPCVTPNSPTLAVSNVTAGGTRLTITPPAANPPTHGYLVVRSTNPTAPTVTNGSNYTSGGGYTVVSDGTGTVINNTGLTSNTTYYYFVYSQNKECLGSPYYSAVSTISQTTCAAAPTGAVSNPSADSAIVSWNPSAVGGGAGPITYTFELYTNAGYTIPVSGYPITNAVSPVSITGLASNTTYYYRIKASNGVCDSTYLSGNFSTSCYPYTIPYFEGFESGYTHNTAVGGCISQAAVTGSDVWLANSSLTDYNRGPRTGGWNTFLRYGNERWMFIPVQLNGGTAYYLELYARQDGATSSNANITVSYGNTNTNAGMTNTIVPATGLVNGNYQKISGEFTPSASGTYYVGIKGNINYSPWYISLDDISIIELPPCSGTPIGGTTILDPDGGSPSSQVNGYVTGATQASGLTYQWQYSDDGFNWTDISGQTGTNLSVTAKSTIGTREYRRAITCSGLTEYSKSAVYTTGYCHPQGTNSSYYIKDFYTTSGVQNITNMNSGFSPNGYGDFYNIHTVSAIVGESINFTANFPTGQTYGVRIWVDWNQDGIFDPVNEVAWKSTSYEYSQSGSITVPASALEGETRMRVVGHWFSPTGDVDPCETGFIYGEFEDYKFIVGSPCIAKIISATADPVCGSGDAEIQVVGNGSTTQLRLYLNSSDPSPLAVINASSGTFTISGITSDTTYYVAAAASGCESIRKPVAIDVQPSPEDVFIARVDNPVSGICEFNYAQLTASGGEFDEDIIVFSESFDGNSFPTGWVFANYDDQHWSISNTNYSGGSPNELELYYHGFEIGTWSARTPNININGLSSINLEFKQNLDHFSISYPYSIYVETSTNGGANWTVQWSVINVSADVGPETRTINLDALAGNSNLLVRFRLTGEEFGFFYWTLDDVKVSGDVDAKHYEWTPTTGLYTNAALTIPYTGGHAETVYAAPWGEETYTVTAGNPVNSCKKTKDELVTNNTSRFSAASTGNWNLAANWTPAVVPNLDRCVRVPNGKTVTVNIDNAEAKTVILDTTGKMIIDNDKSLTVQGAVTNNGAAGDLLVKSGAGLIQIDDVANTGQITVERSVQDMNNQQPNMDYVYWSSPVAGQNIYNFSPYTPQLPQLYGFLEYYEGNDYFYNTSDINFLAAKGYAIRAEDAPLLNGYSKPYYFTGVPHNGNYPFQLKKTNQGYNLTGNPYPSNIDFEVLYAMNSSRIDKIMYLWTNNNPEQYQQGSGYSGNNYAVYTGSGGTPPTSGADPSSGGGFSMNAIPTGIVSTSQGFIVRAKDGANNQNLVFENHDASDVMLRVPTVTPFFQKETKDRFWLTLTSPANIVNTALIAYVPGATYNLDGDYDAEFWGASDGIFTLLSDKQLIIQGRQYPLDINDAVPLGYKAFETGTYIISIPEKEGIFAENQSVWLIDKLLNKSVNLSLKPYKFLTRAGEYTDRFLIVYKPKNTIGTAADISNQILFAKVDNQIVITSTIDKITDVEIFDLNSRSVYSKSEINSNEHKINAFDFNHQVIVVTVKTDKGEFVTQKFVNN